MKILKIYPLADNPKRLNYQVNYGVWDAISGDKVILEKFNANLNNYDVVFLPMYKRWEKHMTLFNRIKDCKVKTVLFDNDSQYRSFDINFYKDLDYIFYRSLDKDNKKPSIKSSWLKWCIDTNLYKPIYGGNGVSFNCTITNVYTYRIDIKNKTKGLLKHTTFKGNEYIKHLQKSAAAIHSSKVDRTHAKILEFAACGTQIISNKSNLMNKYFPDDLVIYFKDISELKKIIKDFKPNIEIQKELRYITETKHDNKIRAKEVIDIIKENI